jgi:hypothetical protein
MEVVMEQRADDGNDRGGRQLGSPKPGRPDPGEAGAIRREKPEEERGGASPARQTERGGRQLEEPPLP